MDANFRLKNRLRTSSRTDPGLGTGWAYFAPDEEYKQHVLKYATQEEVQTASIVILRLERANCLSYHQISTCSGFEALSNANQVKPSRAFVRPVLEPLSAPATRSGDQRGWEICRRVSGK